MAESGDKEDADHHLEMITDCLSGLLSAHETLDVDKDLVNDGKVLMKQLKEARAYLGEFDVRELFVGDKKMIDALQSYQERAATLDSTINDSKDKCLLSMIQKNIRMLNLKLNSPWNSSLPVPVNRESEVNVLPVNDERNDQEQADNNVEWQFFKVETTDTTYKCPDCDENQKPYTNAQSFQRHCKTKHNKSVKPVKPKIKCLLPHTRGTRVVDEHGWDSIYVHLSGVHKLNRPSQEHKLRGFVKEKGVMSVVFLKDGEQDPVDPAQQIDDGTEQDPVVNVDNDPRPILDAEDNVEALEGLDADLPEQVSVNKNDDHAEGNVSQRASQEKNSPDFHGFSQSDAADQGQVLTKFVEGLMEDIPAEPNDDTEMINTEAETVNPEGLELSLEMVEPEKEKETSNKAIDFGEMIVEDALYDSNPEHSANEVFNEDSILVVEEDSGIDDEDDDDYTRDRLNHQILRYRERKIETKPLHEMPENKHFIEEFTKFIVDSSESENPDISTLSFKTGLLFRHDDSLLRWEHSKDSTFNLGRLVDFHSDSFLEMRFPMPWINSIAGADNKQKPSRRYEMLKAHARLRDFVRKKFRETVFSRDIEAILRKDKIKDHLNDLDSDMENSNIWGKLKKQMNATKKIIDEAKEIVNPTDHSSKVGDLNQRYFSSDPYKKRSEANKKIWTDAVEAGNVGVKNFNQFSNFVRHLVFFWDRCREGVYQKITHGDFTNRKEIWFPRGFNVDAFEGLPSEKGHNLYEKQDRSPDAFTMVVPGSRAGLKNGEDAHITLFPSVNEWCLRYVDLVNILLGEQDLDSPFFVSYQPARNKCVALTHMTNGKGSILYEYGQVTGDSNITSNTFRRELETKVRTTHNMNLRSKIITQHSSQVGDAYYEKNASEYRASAMQYINSREGNLDIVDEASVSDEVAAKRAKYETAAKEKSLEQAKNILKQHKTPRNLAIGPNCKVIPADRIYLQETFGSRGALASLNLHVEKFPNDSNFKRVFYRVIDGGHVELTKDQLERMRSIERSVFGGIRKKAMDDFEDKWQHTLAQNKHADQLVASAIRSSFKSAEKNNQIGFFKF